jgi:hypothetical protein
VYDFWYQLKKHNRRKHCVKMELFCCGIDFKNMGAWATHKFIAHCPQARSYVCCSYKGYTNRENLAEHRLVVHNEKELYIHCSKRVQKKWALTTQKQH